MLQVGQGGCSIVVGRDVQETTEDLMLGNYDKNLSGFDKKVRGTWNDKGNREKDLGCDELQGRCVPKIIFLIEYFGHMIIPVNVYYSALWFSF